MRYGRWALMRPPCSAALMRPLCVRPECPAFLYPGVRAAGYSSQTHGDAAGAVGPEMRQSVTSVYRRPHAALFLRPSTISIDQAHAAPLSLPHRTPLLPCHVRRAPLVGLHHRPPFLCPLLHSFVPTCSSLSFGFLTRIPTSAPTSSLSFGFLDLTPISNTALHPLPPVPMLLFFV